MGDEKQMDTEKKVTIPMDQTKGGSDESYEYNLKAKLSDLT